LLITLNKLILQDYKNLEIIVVDNGSTDETFDTISKKFPDIKLIISSKNVGVGAFNLGLKEAIGDYILLLDDDSYPDFGTLKEGVRTLFHDNNIAVAAFSIFNEKYKFSETENLAVINPTYFLGCGALIRKSVVNRIGLYDDLYFIYCNEVDLSIRLLNEGYKIIYLKDNLVTHFSSQMEFDTNYLGLYCSEFRYFHVTIGHLIFLVKHFSIQWVVLYSLKWLLNRIIVAFRFKFIKTFFKALVQFAKMFQKVIASRKVVKKEIQKLYNYGNFPLMDRDFFPNFDKKNFLNFD
jgi:GT2 family glycosyltransferase